MEMHISQRTLLVVNVLVIAAFVGALAVFAQEADTTPPVISGVGVSGITTTGANVAWTTDEPADSQVLYGTTTAYGLETTLNTATTTAHAVALSGLESGATYHVIVRSKDESGNVATSSDYMFTTLTPDTTPPVISGVGISSITQTSALVSWTTNEPADGQVAYGTTTAYGLSTALNTATTTGHAVALSGLSGSTTYHVMVKSRDGSGNLATSSDYMFTTLAAPILDTTAPVISGVNVSGIGGTAAIVNWTTNEPADGRVHYGTTTAYGFSSVLQAATTTAHSVGLSGLATSTLYHFIVTSKDAAGNAATSSDGTFTTLADSATTTPPTAEVQVRVNMEPKTLNVRSRGKWVSVRVAFPAGYDARTVDASSIKLNGSLSPKKVKVKRLGKWADDDTVSYLNLKFSRSALIDLLMNGNGNSPVVFTTKNVTITGTIGGKTFGGATTVRVMGVLSFSDGILFRAADASEVYVIVNGKKRHIPSIIAFTNFGYSWSSVKVVSGDELNSYEGEVLLRAEDSPKVYIISGGKRRHVTDPTVFEAQGLDWEDISVVNPNVLASYPLVSAITLLRAAGDERVYFISGGARHWVPSASVFNRRGFSWNDVVIVDESERDRYSLGKNLD